MKNGQLQHLNPWQKVLFFIAAFVFALSLAQLVSYSLAKVLLNTSEPFKIITDLTRIDAIRMMKITNLVIHLIAFILPAVVINKLFNFEPKEAVLFKRPHVSVWIIVPVLFVFLTSTNELLTNLNGQIDFSFISESLQEKLKYQQAMQMKTTYAFVGGTVKSYFINLILIALIPAISEELIFRGVLQNLIGKATQNIWIGILVSALLFALMHRQPFHFLPIFFLGVLYGSIAAYTGSLWITMLLHFANNALLITLYFFARTYETSIPELSTMAIGVGGLSSLIITGVYLKLKPQASQWNSTKGIYFR
ncbi:CPBP family intramembrane glutamic endopeptidase [Parvicella tangerina]|uniref:CAAX prenyl protease 2/Lysostaphin resistance protein A-like domain-containing protein n=1 Tax=Parvicella tangerina TaxID=2829795 RepID=A0A916NTB9_9FLAO|nr:CPBP family intramembrane glutamic endopeptidase [Parvicella tangerina]CAG5085602.1 hypothetical protein CRYO30217_02810 [Parvicella tangerina]